jgi:uncharacterized damage-inducible protein DinB
MTDLAGQQPPLISNTIGAEYIAYARRRFMKEYLPKIQKCLAELSEDDIWWRSDETNNSIGNLILHLSGNLRQWIVGGLGGIPDTRNRPQEFSERTHIKKSELLKKLENVLHECDSALERFDDRRLLERITIQGYDATYLDALSHVVEHFAMHLGQIIFITKFRATKDLKFYNL